MYTPSLTSWLCILVDTVGFLTCMSRYFTIVFVWGVYAVRHSPPLGNIIVFSDKYE